MSASNRPDEDVKDSPLIIEFCNAFQPIQDELDALQKNPDFKNYLDTNLPHEKLVALEKKYILPLMKKLEGFKSKYNVLINIPNSGSASDELKKKFDNIKSLFTDENSIVKKIIFHEKNSRKILLSTVFDSLVNHPQMTDIFNSDRFSVKTNLEGTLEYRFDFKEDTTLVGGTMNSFTDFLIYGTKSFSNVDAVKSHKLTLIIKTIPEYDALIEKLIKYREKKDKELVGREKKEKELVDIARTKIVNIISKSIPALNKHIDARNSTDDIRDIREKIKSIQDKLQNITPKSTAMEIYSALQNTVQPAETISKKYKESVSSTTLFGKIINPSCELKKICDTILDLSKNFPIPRSLKQDKQRQKALEEMKNESNITSTSKKSG